MVLVTVVLDRLTDSSIGGRWRADLVGRVVDGGSIEIQDVVGNRVTVTYPSTFFFVTEECRPCARAVQQLNAYVQEPATRVTTPVYMIAKGIGTDWMLAAVSHEQIHAARLVRGGPTLRFIDAVPLVMRTNAAGTVELAFEGVASEDTWRRLIR